MLGSPRAAHRPHRLIAILATFGLAFALMSAAAGLSASAARAGTWTLASCTLPDGSPAPVEGWSAGVYGAGYNAAGSGDADSCATGGDLTATSSSAAAPASYTGPEWIFTAPAGSSVAGGQLTAALTAPQGQAWLGTPGGTYDAADVIAGCGFGSACGSAGVLSGVFAIDHAGGSSIYAPALCVAAGQATCPVGGGAGGINAAVAIHAALIELSTPATPTGDDFSGSLLAGRASGTADLEFTAGDPLTGSGTGPGVYSVTVSVDGRRVFSGTPNTNGGKCTVAGTDPSDGALIFEYLEPCRATERVTVPVDTSALPDGSHTLTVSVTDAAGDAATVLQRTFTTSNPLTTPVPPRHTVVGASFALGFAWDGTRTTLVSARPAGLPSGGRIAVSCTGRGCPHLSPSTVPVARAATLFAELEQLTFRAGDRVYLTVTAPTPVRYRTVDGRRRRVPPAPHSVRTPEHVRIAIRAGRRPGAKLVASVP